MEPSFQEILDDLGQDNAQQKSLLFLGHVSSVELLKGFKDEFEGALGIFLCASMQRERERDQSKRSGTRNGENGEKTEDHLTLAQGLFHDQVL